MKLYIQGSTVVSPLEITLSADRLILSKEENHQKEYFYIKEPKYKDFLKSSTIRRVSRCTKMGLYAALKTIAHQVKIDGVIVGTGLGGLIHSEQFLLEMINGNESGVSPNPFFQSLHSSLSGNIAVHSQCHAYNMTYVNRGNTFENALQDALLHLREDSTQRLLVGSSDEITEKYGDITYRSNYLTTSSGKKNTYTMGEGSAFFLVSGTPSENGIAIEEMNALYDIPEEQTASYVDAMMSSLKISISEIDLIISGHQHENHLYSVLGASKEIQEKNIIFYKMCVGEYPTSSSFALWLAEKILTTNDIPDIFPIKRKNKRRLQRILICNQYKNYTSILMVSKT